MAPSVRLWGKSREKQKILHAATGITEVERDVPIAPDVLLDIAILVLVDGDLFGFVVYPPRCVATTDGALAFIDLRRFVWYNHFDRAAVAG